MHRSAFWLLLAVGFGFGAAVAAQEPVRRALLIGIDKYQAVTPLHGTQNDVAAMRALLVNRYGFPEGNVRMLRNDEATHNGILTAIRETLAEPANRGDISVLYFSGHGSQMTDVSGDESDRLDETLVAVDSRTPGVFDVSDDELNVALSAVVARSPHLTVILDSCESGSAARNMTTARRIPRDMRLPPGATPTAHWRAMQASEGYDALSALGGDYVLVSGSRAEELSHEDLFDGRIHGALTYYLVQAAQADRIGTWRSLFPQVVHQVQARFPSQTPQLEGTGLDSRLFGLREAAGAPWLRVQPDSAARARVLAGAPYGLRKGVTLQVYADGHGEPAGEPLGTLTLDQVGLDEAAGRWSGTSSLPATARARIDRLTYDGRTRGMWLDAALPDALKNAIRSDLHDWPSLELLPMDREPAADFRVVIRADHYGILARDGSVLTATVPTSAEGATAAARLLRQLHDWARWQSLDALSNPSTTLPASLTLRVVGAPVQAPAPLSVPDGTSVEVTIANDSDERLYYALLNLSGDGLVRLLHPAPGAQDMLPAHGKFAKRFRLKAPDADGRDPVVDTFKLIVSTSPVAGELFAQDAIRSVQAGKTPLDQLLHASATATGRNVEIIYGTSDWATAQQSVRVSREAPLLNSPHIALLFEQPQELGAVVDALSTGARSVCPGNGGADCAQARALSADRRVIEVEAPTLSASRDVGGNQRAPSVGEAFEDAYRAGAATGARYAEPLLVMRVPIEESVAGARGSGGSQDDALASDDDRWSLRYANVPAAWAARQQSSGRPAGQEADGVFIGHPDTGYTPHPEFGSGTTPSTIAVKFGHDYVDGDGDSSDPLLDEGFSPQPGHGTRSGSVIVSPEGCQLAGATKCVSGTGPGAHLMPLRVHTSVVVFDTANLARAIEDAATGRWGQKADLVSIAMGGPASYTLHRAVKSAVAQGTLVVAAAGNYVRTVVWPARYSEAVAVSAINPRCEPWRHASRGRAVDISAPGEAVWRATTVAAEPPGGSVVFGIGMGDGTTFATGTTAGIAALWIAHHRNDKDFVALRAQGRIAEAFRATASKTAWRPGDAERTPPAGVHCDGAAAWRPRAFGPGVINAGALLAEELPANADSDTRALAPETLALFFTLYEDEPRLDRVVADYRALFAGAPLADAERFETEVMFHYLASEEVRETLDRLLAAPQAGAGAWETRRALASQDLSDSLRAALAAR